MSCVCPDTWSVQACDLKTGRVRAILDPLTISWETTLNRVGTGSMTLATRSVTMRDIWPHLTAIYIVRTGGGDATPENPAVEFAGLVESVQAEDSGATTVGMKSLEDYWNFRHLRLDNPLVFSQWPQTEIAKYLSDQCLPNGIQLYSLADTSAVARDRAYSPWDFKNIGEALQQLSDVINGPDWELTHVRTSQGEWLTTVIFRDYVGADRGIVLRSGLEASGYRLAVDGAGHASRVIAIGSGEEEDMMSVEREDLSVYPAFEATPAWKDVSLWPTLIQHSEGYLRDNRDPVALPTVTIAGFDPDPWLVRIGDTVQVDVSLGAVTFNGPARVTGIAWRVEPDSAPIRTLTTVPIGRASDTVLNQTPRGDKCEEAC